MATWHGSDVLVRRSPRLWPLFLTTGVALGVLAAAAAVYVVAAFVILFVLLLLFFLPAIVYDDSFRGERRIASVRADGAGLHFGKSLVLPRTRIDACTIEPLPESMCNVQLWGPGRRDDISLLVPSAERARRLLEALGLENDRRVARFLVESAPLRPAGVARLVRLAHLSGAALLVAGVIVLTIRSEWIGFTLVPLMFAYFGLLRRLRRRRRIMLGADALTIETALPLSDIREVRAFGDADAFVNGRLLRFDGRDATAKRDAFVERLKKSLGERDELPIAAMLEPGARERGAWLDHLRRLGGEGYRSGSLPTEALWRVVEHVAASPGARVGALAALVPRLDVEGRSRLAELAEGTVKPEVRSALEAASEPGTTDEDVLEAFAR